MFHQAGTEHGTPWYKALVVYHHSGSYTMDGQDGAFYSFRGPRLNIAFTLSFKAVQTLIKCYILHDIISRKNWNCNNFIGSTAIKRRHPYQLKHGLSCDVHGLH